MKKITERTTGLLISLIAGLAVGVLLFWGAIYLAAWVMTIR